MSSKLLLDDLLDQSMLDEAIAVALTRLEGDAAPVREEAVRRELNVWKRSARTSSAPSRRAANCRTCCEAFRSATSGEWRWSAS